VATRLKYLAAFLLKMCNAQLPVEQSYHAVTSVLEYVMSASREVHMKCANTHAADFWFVPIVV